MWISLASLGGTVGAYVVARWLSRRFRHVLVNPFLIGTLLIFTGLALTGLPYAEYKTGVQPLAFLLGPATVALGVPLYKNLPLLKRNMGPVLVGASVGALVGAFTVTLMALALGMSRVLIYSLIPKSVTTPVAIAITNVLGGDANLSAAMTTLTGFTGIAFVRPLLGRFGIESPLARGLALGVSIHGMGTVAALEEGSLTAAMAGLGMMIAAICTALVAPLIVRVLAI